MYENNGDIMKTEKIYFTNMILKNEKLLNSFLNSIGYNYEPTKHKFIIAKKGVYIFCDRQDSPLSDLIKIVSNSFPMLSSSAYSSKAGLVLISDNQCIGSDEYLELSEDKTLEWHKFLVQTFGYEFVNKYKQMVKEQNKKEQQKNENSRTF